MKSFLTPYSQLSLLSPLRSPMENRCYHEPTYLLKTGLLSFACFTTWRCNRFTPPTSATTANFSSKDFYPTQKQVRSNVSVQSKQQDRHAIGVQSFKGHEGRPFYPKSFPLSENRNNLKNITAKNEFSVLGGRKRLPPTYLPCARKLEDGQQISKDLLTVGSTGTKLLDTTPCTARLSKTFSVQRTGRRAFERSLLPEKFINLLMANGEKDKARRCFTQALFSITTHCQKHNLRNNSPLKIFTDSFFKQESTESKPNTADNSLQRASLATVQQGAGSTKPLLPKGKSDVLLVSKAFSKRNANPGKSVNVLRDVGLVLLETRLDNVSNGRYSGTKKRKLYPSLKEGQGLPSMGKSTSIFRLNNIERVEKRLLSKQNGFFFLFVKQKGNAQGEKQTSKFKVPLSLPFCGKSFETTFPVFLPRATCSKLYASQQNNPFLSSIRLSLRERFLISEKGFAFLALHKKVQQSYLCSALLHLPGNEKRYQTLVFKALLTVGSTSKYRTYTTTQTQQIHFLPFLPYSTLFNWREKRLNPLFGFAKQSRRFLLELVRVNRSVKGTEKIRQNNLLGFLPLLSCFYSARTPSSPFSLPSIIIRPVAESFEHENNPLVFKALLTVGSTSKCSKLLAKAKKSSFYKDEYVQQDTKLETKGLDKFVACDPSCLQARSTSFQQTKEVSDRLVLLKKNTSVVRAFPSSNASKSEHKQPPQNDSHSNTKDKKTPLCFTQGIPPLAKKAFSQEKDTKAVHMGVLLKGIQRVQPTLEVRRVRKGRNTFQVPSVVKQKRGEKVGIKWIIDSARRSKRKGNKLFSDSLANQLVQSFDRLGEARSKRNELLKLAESNRPFLRFRWW